jgi:hypothetical protein
MVCYDLFGKAPCDSDSVWEMILSEVVLFDFFYHKLLKSEWRITSQEKLLFLAPSILVHFRKPLNTISRESLLNKLLAELLHKINRESALRALPNALLMMMLICR